MKTKEEGNINQMKIKDFLKTYLGNCIVRVERPNIKKKDVDMLFEGLNFALPEDIGKLNVMSFSCFPNTKVIEKTYGAKYDIILTIYVDCDEEL